jgi:hypothetical protein
VQATVLVSVFRRNILLPSSGLKHTSHLNCTAVQSVDTNHTALSLIHCADLIGGLLLFVHVDVDLNTWKSKA